MKKIISIYVQMNSLMGIKVFSYSIFQSMAAKKMKILKVLGNGNVSLKVGTLYV